VPSAALVRELRLWKYPSTLSCKRPRDPAPAVTDAALCHRACSRVTALRRPTVPTAASVPERSKYPFLQAVSAIQLRAATDAALCRRACSREAPLLEHYEESGRVSSLGLLI
jgi:hypothetical protein